MSGFPSAGLSRRQPGEGPTSPICPRLGAGAAGVVAGCAAQPAPTGSGVKGRAQRESPRTCHERSGDSQTTRRWRRPLTPTRSGRRTLSAARRNDTPDAPSRTEAGIVDRTVGGGSGRKATSSSHRARAKLGSVESMIRGLRDHLASRPRLQQTACHVSPDIHNSYPQHRGTDRWSSAADSVLYSDRRGRNAGRIAAAAAMYRRRFTVVGRHRRQ
jgi:hypothetical protein